MSKVTGFRLKEAQTAKLGLLAAELGISPNAVVCRLVENAQICDVVRREPVAIFYAEARGGRSLGAHLPEKNNRHDAKFSEATSITAVGA